MKSIHSDRTKGVIALVILAFIFASMGVFVRFLQTDFTILQQTYVRIFAAFMLSIVLFYKDLHVSRLKKINKREWGILFLRAISLYLIAVPLVSQAYVSAKYSNVSFIGALPLTAVLGFLLLKEKITLRKVLYVLLGLGGVVLIAVKDYSHLLQWGQGELLALIASIFFAFSYITRKWQGNLLNNKEIAVIIFGISSILLFFTSVIPFHEKIAHPQTWTIGIISVILIAGLFNVVSLFLTNYGFQKVDAVLGSNLLMLEVVFAVILGFLFYFEIPTLKEFTGGALIVLSAYWMNKAES